MSTGGDVRRAPRSARDWGWSGKSGYAPACANAWRSDVCEKPPIKRGDCCGNRLLIPLSDAVVYDHLTGKHTVGVYPLLEDDSCYFPAVDFDETVQRGARRPTASHVRNRTRKNDSDCYWILDSRWWLPQNVCNHGL